MSKHMNFRQKSAQVHEFAIAPRADIPRSSFRMQKSYKTTMDSGYLVPFYVEEVLPGDTFNLGVTTFCRLATPVFPVMDNLHLDCFFFFAPNRLLWSNWVKFMGQQDNPGDSISFSVPQVVSAAGGFPVGSVYDYFGLPTVGQVGGGNTVSVNALPLRAYNRIWNEWFRDENLQNSVDQNNTQNGPDPVAEYTLLRRGKRHDYFTSALPFVQKGTAIGIPLGTSAPVSISPILDTVSDGYPTFEESTGNDLGFLVSATATGDVFSDNVPAGASAPMRWNDPQLEGVADLSAATSATINQLRQAFQIQKLLERDARGGTRYTEIVRSHFGVISPDARLQRTEYLGGGSVPILFSAIPQTAPGEGESLFTVGSLGASAQTVARNGFSQSFTEHGYIIGLVMVRADLTYQQGLRKMWSRSTRYDFYFPVFAALGEQAILNKEIYCDGSAADDGVFGYQERWAEYRYNPSEITGLFKSTSAGAIDQWHLAQEFGSLPTLNSTFIEETPPLERILAVGDVANGKQLLLDCLFDIKAARPMPMYSVPGMIDHF